MSDGIKENTLVIAPSAGLTDFWRIVTAGGLSQQLLGSNVLKAIQPALKRLTNADSPHTILDTDNFIFYLIDTTAGTVVINLPDSTSNDGKEMFFYLTDSTNLVTINRGGADTFEFGATLLTMTQEGQVLHLLFDSANTRINILNESMKELRDFSPAVTGAAGLTVTSFSTLYYKFKVQGNKVGIFYEIQLLGTTGTGYVRVTLPIPNHSVIFAGDYFTAGGVSPQLSYVIKINSTTMEHRLFNNATYSGLPFIQGNFEYFID